MDFAFIPRPETVYPFLGDAAGGFPAPFLGHMDFTYVLPTEAVHLFLDSKSILRPYPNNLGHFLHVSEGSREVDQVSCLSLGDQLVLTGPIVPPSREC